MTKVELLLFDSLPSLPECPDNKYIRTHLDSIKSIEYKTCSALGWSLLADMLSKYYYIDISDLNIITNDYGKPILKSNQHIHFNISHTDYAVTCAVSDSPVGIDIESIEDIKESLLNKCFTINEITEIKTSTDFYKYWTLKEAYLKAIGTGVNRRLSDIEFSCTENIVCKDSGKLVPFNFYTSNNGKTAISLCSTDLFSPSDLRIKLI